MLTTTVGLSTYKLINAYDGVKSVVHATTGTSCVTWGKTSIDILPIGVDEWLHIKWKPPSSDLVALVPTVTSAMEWQPSPEFVRGIALIREDPGTDVGVQLCHLTSVGMEAVILILQSDDFQML
jgi:hypothetical protein